MARARSLLALAGMALVACLGAHVICCAMPYLHVRQAYACVAVLAVVQALDLEDMPTIDEPGMSAGYRKETDADIADRYVQLQCRYPSLC